MTIKTYSIIFGLSADPVHKGHEQVIINSVEFIREQGFEIERLILIPVYQPNLIADKKAPIASFQQRVKMCEIVAKRLSKQLTCKINVSQVEKQLVGITSEKNYSYNTIKHLNIHNLLFMVSADHFSGRWPKFRKWYNWQELLKVTGLLINQRPGQKINRRFIEELKIINPHIKIVENKKSIKVSSSQIRAGEINLNHLSEDVFRYIQENNIYEALA